MISGYGSTSGFSMYLQDRAGGELTDFYQIFQQFIGALNQRPEIERAYSSFNINFPQYMVHIDPAKAKRAGVSPSTILSTIAGYYGGQYASYINRFSKMYYVTLQSRPEDRLDVESLNNIYVRTDKGEMAPVGEFVELEKVYSSDVLNRFNLYNAISVQGTAAPAIRPVTRSRPSARLPTRCCRRATATSSTVSPARRPRRRATR